MNSFTIHILAADRVFYEGPCESLILPTISGLYGILALHREVVCAIVPGEMKWRIPGGEDQYAAVSAGLVKVEKNDVLILVDSVERPEEIDEIRAKRASDEAKEALLQRRSIQEYHSAEAKLARALSRLRVKRRDNTFNG